MNRSCLFRKQVTHVRQGPYKCAGARTGCVSSCINIYGPHCSSKKNKDRFHVWLNRVYWLPLVFLSLALLAFGGWSYVMWAGFFRVTFNFHATWLVNSATHMWGTRRFSTGDDSRNNWWVALLTFGEGWHNNHHAHPTAARHGLAWYEIDINWWGIRVMQFLGLARAIKLVSLSQRFLA